MPARKGQKYKPRTTFAVIPVMVTCALCPQRFIRGHSQHKYCDGCRETGNKLKMREWWSKNREPQLEKKRSHYYPLYYQKNASKINAKIKEYVKTEAGRRMRVRCEANQRIRNPQKIAARQMVRCAIVCGMLVKKICERCQNPKAEAHHDDYTKPLEVRWLCHRCHRIRHQELGDGGFGYGINSRSSNGRFAPVKQGELIK